MATGGLYFGEDYGVPTWYLLHTATSTPCSAKEQRILRMRVVLGKYSAVTAWASLYESHSYHTIDYLILCGYRSLHTYIFAFQRRRCLVCMREWRGVALEGVGQFCFLIP